MDPLIERAADGANRDAPRRKAFIVINFTRMVKQAQAADKQRREKKDAIQHTMKERGDDGRDGSWLLVFYSRVLRDSSSHLLLIITHAAEKERGRGRIALETQDRWKKKVTFFFPLARWPNVLLNAKSYEQAAQVAISQHDARRW